MAITVAPFGAYTAVTEVTSAAAQTQILAQVTKLANLIPDPGNVAGNGVRVQGAVPDFDQIHPEMANRLQVEIKALKVAIDAAPTA